MFSNTETFVDQYIRAFCDAKDECERSALADALMDLQIQNAITAQQLIFLAETIITGESLRSCSESVLFLLGSFIAYLEFVPPTGKPLELFLGDCNGLTSGQMDAAITIIKMARDAKFIDCLESMYSYAGFADRQSIQSILSELRSARLD